MKHIYINIEDGSVLIKNKKQTLIKEYQNISLNKKSNLLNSVKLIFFALNKIKILDNQFYNEEYLFYINNKDILFYLKDEQNNFYEKIKKEWALDSNTLSEVGNLLQQLKRFNFKDFIYFEIDAEYLLKQRIEELNKKQSSIDSLIQDVLHDIRKEKREELSLLKSQSYIYKIHDLEQDRSKIKKEIKNLGHELKKMK